MLISTFEMELRNLLNRWGAEKDSDTPDYMLSKYLLDCLRAYERILVRREAWYGRRIASAPLHELTVGVADVGERQVQEE
jgi:hypothetical protein